MRCLHQIKNLHLITNY